MNVFGRKGDRVLTRPRRSIFKDLLFTMLAFGTIMGLGFPPFAAVALQTRDALTFGFFAICVTAGLVLGSANFVLFKVVVSRQISRIVRGMQQINESVEVASGGGKECQDNCKLEVTSNDLIGDVAVSFNSMTEAIGRRITVESTARRLLAELSTSFELDVVSREILEALGDVCQAKAGVLYGDTGKKLELLHSYGIDRSRDTPDRLDVSQGLAERALATGKVVSASPSRDGLEWVSLSSPLGGFRPELVLLVPLMAEQRAVGLAVVASSTEALTDEQTLLVDAIRTQAAPYLHTAVLHQKLRDLAAIDDLTRVLNRRFGLRRLNEEFSRAVRHGVPLSVLMVDIDRFKSFNDSFGHDAGDAVLIAVAAGLERMVRSGDVVCRYGGEELMIVAPGMGMNDAAQAGERLRRLVETTPVPWRDQTMHVTISVGVASWPVVRASIPEELVTCADQALYHAKDAGRNRVSVHQGEHVVALDAISVDHERISATGPATGSPTGSVTM